MNTIIIPDKFERKTSLIELELARLKMAQELRHRYNWAIELIAREQVTVSDALGIIQSRTAKEYITRSQEEEKENKLRLLLLTKIEGVDLFLAEDLIDEFGSLEAIAQATPTELEIVPGIEKNRAEEIVKEVSKLMNQI